MTDCLPKHSLTATLITLGSQCNPQIDCEDWAGRGYGSHYWAIRALVGFHDKLNVAHEYLQDSVLDNFLSLDEIADDFTTPENWTTYDDLLALLGTAFYLVGGISGFGGLASSWAGSAAAARGVSRLVLACKHTVQGADTPRPRSRKPLKLARTNSSRISKMIALESEFRKDWTRPSKAPTSCPTKPSRATKE